MATAVQVQYRRGTAAQVASFTGAAGEMVVDTSNDRVVVQDGSTAGGFAAAKLSEVGGGHLNKFRNGTFDVWQRGAAPSLSAGTSGAQYTADGWAVGWTASASAAPAIAQAGGRLLTKSSLEITGATNLTDVYVWQRIESLIAAAFCSQTVTVQAQVYNNTGGAITPKLTVNRPSVQDDYASVTADVNAVPLQSCANGAWTQVAYTFSANAASYNGLEIVFDFGNNFSSSSKSIQIAECDIRVTAGIPAGQQTPANFIPPVELRHVASETVFCQRYYWQWTPGNNAPVNILSAFSGTQAWGALFDLPVTMRAAPTCAVSSAAHFSMSAGGGGKTVTATDFTNSTPSTVATWNGWTASSASFAAGQAIILVTQSASAWISASAEL